MKKQLIGIILCIYSLTASGQITKGNWMVGGNGSSSTDNNSSTSAKITNIQIAPNIGYFILDKFASGLKINYIFQRESYNGHSINTNSLNIGPFIRYYFLNEEKFFNLFVEGNYSYGVYKTSGIYPISNGKKSNYSFSLGPVVYFNSSVGLEFSIIYYKNRDITQNITHKGLNVGLGFQIHLKK